MNAASGANPFLRGVGISLLIFAAVFLVVGVIFRPLMPPVVHAIIDGVYDALLCGADEQYHQDPLLRGALRRNIVGNGDAWCENAAGQRRDISFSEFNVAVALFALPAVVGMVLLFRGAAKSVTASPSSVFKGSIGGDLSSRLQELQNAYDKGLITEAEYQQTRANLLRQMGK